MPSKLRIGAGTTPNQYGITGLIPGDMVFQTIGNNQNHGMIFYLKNNQPGNYFKFGDVNNGIWIKFGFDKIARFDGAIYAKEIQVSTNVWADYVFTKEYKLLSLKDLDKYITINKHLPEIPTEKDIFESGIDVGKINVLLLKKIEELTLYMIQINDKCIELENQVSTLKLK